MILADKIIMLRKKNGLSQEELAEKMNVSRQSVSKWEGAQSVPDLNKIIMLSEIFGVSTDYLLKDSIEEPDLTPAEDNGVPLRSVSMEEANEFLDGNRRFASGTAFGTLLCVLSVIPMIMLGVLSDVYNNDIIAGAGVGIMLCIIAAAVAVFIRSASFTEKFGFLNKEPIDTAYGVDGLAKERLEQYRPVFSRQLTAGIVFILIGVPIMIVMGVIGERQGGDYENILGGAGLCIMLAFIAAGVWMIVKTSVIKSGFEKLLQEGDYSPAKKQENNSSANIIMIYWLVLTAAYLGVSFLTRRWDITWVIFAVGGVLTPAVKELTKKKKG